RTPRDAGIEATAAAGLDLDDDARGAEFGLHLHRTIALRTELDEVNGALRHGRRDSEDHHADLQRLPEPPRSRILRSRPSGRGEPSGLLLRGSDGRFLSCFSICETSHSVNSRIMRVLTPCEVWHTFGIVWRCAYVFPSYSRSTTSRPTRFPSDPAGGFRCRRPIAWRAFAAA